MKRIVFIALLLAMLPFGSGAAGDLLDYEGTWHILRSSIPMWQHSGRTEPRVKYTACIRNNTQGLFDEVIFKRNGRDRSIEGFDFPRENSNTKFRWKGFRLLSKVTSDWETVYMSPDKQWMIIHFAKTTFTKEGYDVLSRDKAPNAATQTAIEKKLKELGIASTEKIG